MDRSLKYRKRKAAPAKVSVKSKKAKVDVAGDPSREPEPSSSETAGSVYDFTPRKGSKAEEDSKMDPVRSPKKKKKREKEKHDEGAPKAASENSGNSKNGESDESFKAPAVVVEEKVKKVDVKPETEPAAKLKKRKKTRALLKPDNGSWLSHIGSILVYRCVQSAMARSQDYREPLEEGRDWAQIWRETHIARDDLELVWFLIKKEFNGQPLKQIESELKRYVSLSTAHFTKEETRLKYKDQLPKPPVSAFLLYSTSVLDKFKKKFPNLTRRELSLKIGEKWKSMSAEKQQKYRDQYAQRRDNYKIELEDFYAEHPEAKALKLSRRKDLPSKRASAFGPEDVHIRELRKLRPKCPPTAFFLYCKEKRNSFHKKFPDLNPKEITAKLSERWRAKDQKSKAIYQKKYIDCRCVYLEEMKKFHLQYPEAERLLARKSKGESSTASLRKLPKVKAQLHEDRQEDRHEEKEMSTEGEEDSDASDSEAEIEAVPSHEKTKDTLNCHPDQQATRCPPKPAEGSQSTPSLAAKSGQVSLAKPKGAGLLSARPHLHPQETSSNEESSSSDEEEESDSDITISPSQ